MDDAGAHLAADAAEVVDVMQQRVHQRAVGISFRRVDDEAGWLVQHHDVGVFIQNRQRNVLCLDLDRRYLRHRETHRIPAACCPGLGGFAVQGGVAFL
jgi:hypothetical protein